MKVNSNTAIHTPLTLLVPYGPNHVPTYHAWMQDAELQVLTASEPLSLAQEYAMQEKWRVDGDKLTFIVCLGAAPMGAVDETAVVRAGKLDAPENMVGDVNLFLCEEEEDEEEEEDDDDDDDDDEHLDQKPHPDEAPAPAPAAPSPALSAPQSTAPKSPKQKPTKRPQTGPLPALVGELEIMIAQAQHRGRGLARSTLLGFLAYIHAELPAILAEYTAYSATQAARQHRHRHRHQDQDRDRDQAQGPTLRYLRARINASNTASIRLFESVGFVRRSGGANVFGEIEMRTRVEGGRFVDVEGKVRREGLEGFARRVGYVCS